MNPADYTKAFADFWSNGSQAMMKAQEDAGRAFADGMKAMAAGKIPGLAALPGDMAAGSADMTRAGQAVMDLWSAASTLSNTLAAKLPAARDGNSSVETTFRRILDPRAWLAASGGEMDEVLGRMAEGPRFADLWDVERRYARVMQAWVDMRRRALEHQAVVLQAWLRAGKQFTDDLASASGGEAKAADPKATLAVWTETANKELLETQRSDDFLHTQTAMLRASTELRLAQQELVEHYGRQYGFPTRIELDDVHRTVTELRREMRALRKQLHAQAAPDTIPPPSTASKPAGRRASSSPARN